MPETATLPHSASPGELAALIRGVQSRSRTGLAEPERLAVLVCNRIGLAERMAREVGLRLHDLAPSMQAWEGESQGGGNGGSQASATIIQVTTISRDVEVIVRRGHPPTGIRNGVLYLMIRGEDR